jgi:deoxycytidylate deaminase
MKHKQANIITACVLALASTNALAERNFLAWGRVHDTTATTTTQRGVAVTMDRRGNVIATGYNDVSNDTWYTVKYDSLSGAIAWAKTYSNGVGDDRPVAIVTDSNGDVIVTGYSTSTNQRDYYTIKYDGVDGSVIWQVRYNNSAQNGGDEPVAIAVDASDNVIVTGKSFGSGTSDDIQTLKYAASNGAIVRNWRYSSNQVDIPTALAIAPNGEPVVVGRTRVNGSNTCYYTVRYNLADNNAAWDETFDHPNNGDDVATGVAVAPDGTVLVTGTVRNPNTATYSAHTLKYAAAGGAPV